MERRIRPTSGRYPAPAGSSGAARDSVRRGGAARAFRRAPAPPPTARGASSAIRSAPGIRGQAVRPRPRQDRLEGLACATARRTVQEFKDGQPHRLGRRPDLLRDPLARPGAHRARLDPRPRRRPEERHGHADEDRQPSRRRPPPWTPSRPRSSRSPRTAAAPGWRSSSPSRAPCGARRLPRRLHARLQRDLRGRRRGARSGSCAPSSSLVTLVLSSCWPRCAVSLVVTGPLARGVGDAIGLGSTARDDLEHREVAGAARRRHGHARPALRCVAEREAARGLPQPRCRVRGAPVDRRLGRLRLLRGPTSAPTTRPTARWPGSSSASCGCTSRTSRSCWAPR